MEKDKILTWPEYDNVMTGKPKWDKDMDEIL